VHRVARTLSDLAGRTGTVDEEFVVAALTMRMDPARVTGRVA
jgi:hypothetical protein